jgi:hypothetical protein
MGMEVYRTNPEKAAGHFVLNRDDFAFTQGLYLLVLEYGDGGRQEEKLILK